jgi:hypothetical protein
MSKTVRTVVAQKPLPLSHEGCPTVGWKGHYNIMLRINRPTACLARPVALRKAEVECVSTERITNQSFGVILVEAVKHLE